MNFRRALYIIELRNNDLRLRKKLIQNGELRNGYNKEMKALHIHNAETLKEIIYSIGYPTIDKVGKEANEAAWLIIQHSISKPDLMKKCALLLEKEVEQKNAHPKDLAYLTDRIAVFEDRPQLYGTQFDWDETGTLNPSPFDDLEKVNNRRKSIGLNALEEQTIIMREQAVQENQSAPTDYLKRKHEMDHWKKKVGWIK